MTIYSSTGAYAYISTPANTTTTLADTWYRLEGTFTNEVLEGFDIVTEKLTYLGQTQCFEIKVNASFTSDINNTEITMALFKNDVLQTNSIMTVEINQITDKIMISLVDMKN